ncbi:MAG: tetratricopeptide repeat protein [Anaeromyxobacter sp.]
MVGAVALFALVAAATPKVAVLDIEIGQGVEIQDRAVLTDALASALHDPEAFNLIATRDVTALLGLQYQKQLLGNPNDTGNVAQVAQNLGTDGAIATSVGKVGDGLVVSARLIETKSANVVARSTVPVPGKDILAALRRVGYEIRREYRAANGLAAPPEPEPLAAGAAPAPEVKPPEQCTTVTDCDLGCRQSSALACVKLGTMLAEGPPKDPGRAAPAFERACELGETAQCAPAADAYLTVGLSTPAVRLLQRACLSGEVEGPKSCARAAEILWEGKGLMRDATSAVALAKRACDANNGLGCVIMGYALVKGEGGVQKDRKKAAELISGACAKGDETACLGMGDVAKEAKPGEVTKEQLAPLGPACEKGLLAVCVPGAEAAQRFEDPELALKLYRHACMNDAPDAAKACDVGGNLWVAKGGDAAPVGAELQRKACTLGNNDACVRAAISESFLATAQLPRIKDLLLKGCNTGAILQDCFNTALALVTGRGSLKDPKVALAIFEKACAGGHGPSCRSAATSYRVGTTVAKDVERSADFTELACKNGQFPECIPLAQAFEDGRSVKKNEKRAVAVLDMACTGGFGPACKELADRYQVGKNVSEDDKRYREYKRKACDAATSVKEMCKP